MWMLKACERGSTRPVFGAQLSNKPRTMLHAYFLGKIVCVPSPEKVWEELQMFLAWQSWTVFRCYCCSIQQRATKGVRGASLFRHSKDTAQRQMAKNVRSLYHPEWCCRRANWMSWLFDYMKWTNSNQTIEYLCPNWVNHISSVRCQFILPFAATRIILSSRIMQQN